MSGSSDDELSNRTKTRHDTASQGWLHRHGPQEAKLLWRPSQTTRSMPVAAC
jgi:hypothetical protein